MKNHIKYPVGKEFNLKMLLTQQNLIKDAKKKITKVGLFLKIKRDIAKGKIELVGKKSHKGRGRPQSMYQVVGQETVPGIAIQNEIVPIEIVPIEIAQIEIAPIEIAKIEAPNSELIPA